MILDEEEEKSDNNYLNDCLNVINTKEYDNEENGEGGGDCEDTDMS